LIGLAGIITGVLIRLNYDDYEELTSKNIGGVSILLIALGGIIFIVAFFGCCGAIRKSVIMLTIVCNYCQFNEVDSCFPNVGIHFEEQLFPVTFRFWNGCPNP
jgi:hypothetical protein